MKKSCFGALFALFCFSAQAQQFYFSAIRPTACGSTDGIITIVPTRGVPPFTYAWSNGGSELSAKGLTSGVYSATLTDATGATVTHTHILNSEAFDLYLTSSLPATNCTPYSGKLSVSAVSGTPPFSFLWSNGQSTETASGLAVGTYSVTATDATGCTAQGTYMVDQPSGFYYPSASINTLNSPDCTNQNGGTLVADLMYSGYQPYSYQWTGGATTPTVTGLPAGTYFVTVTDVLGCSSVQNYVLENAIEVTSSVICSGSLGTATAELTNGTPPINYQWGNGSTGPVLNNVPSGYYAVTATDATGCMSSGYTNILEPVFSSYNNTAPCHSANEGIASVYVYYDTPISYLWDNGATEAIANNLSDGNHTVTVTTALGCTLTGSVYIPAAIAPAYTINHAETPADCQNNAGGALNITITGGLPGYQFYSYGPNGFFSNDVASMNNLKAGDYYLSVNSGTPYYCGSSTTVTLDDLGGFNPVLEFEPIDCTTGFGSGAITNVTSPGAQYSWSTGASVPALFNLTEGCYTVTVSAGGSCLNFFDFCIFKDSLQGQGGCSGSIAGRLINDAGIPGCSGTLGIPYELIQAQPSGAMHFTDENGAYNFDLPEASFDISPVLFNPADIACPAGSVYTVMPTIGVVQSGYDFHFLNPNNSDMRVSHTALRTAQPGFPYSMRFDVCNDGSVATSGSLDLTYANFLQGLNTGWFGKLPGQFNLVSETMGIPDNNASFSYTSINPGNCNTVQVDMTVPTSTTLNTEFSTTAAVSPVTGDPTPSNNTSKILTTVMGSFDPNAIYAFPARDGNPLDGGNIWRNVDEHLTYQLFFQNTGNAPANLVVLRDTLDSDLNILTVKNIKTSHKMTVSLEGDNQNVLVFKFPNINLIDSTSDYANSIGMVQYEIDTKPGLATGTEISSSAGIYFDFNTPVQTNTNVLTVTESSSAISHSSAESKFSVFPNPADQYFGFFAPAEGSLRLLNAMGSVVMDRSAKEGLQQFSTSDLPAGVYTAMLTTQGKTKTAKLIIQK